MTVTSWYVVRVATGLGWSLHLEVPNTMVVVSEGDGRVPGLLSALTMVDEVEGTPILHDLLVYTAAVAVGDGDPVVGLEADLAAPRDGDLGPRHVVALDLAEGVTAVRVRVTVEADPEPGSKRVPVVESVQYWIPLRHSPVPQAVLLSFSTPQLAAADVWVDVYDEIARSTRILFEEEMT